MGVGLLVGVRLGVAVSVAVGVPVATVAVDVGDALEVVVADAVGVGAMSVDSNAPISHVPLSSPGSGRGSPRLSVGGQLPIGTALRAGLSTCSAIVSVGPPLFCGPIGSSARSLSITPFMLDGALKKQFESSDRL